jgi:hypothetical protein
MSLLGHHYAARFTTEAQWSQGFDKRTAEVNPARARALGTVLKVEIAKRRYGRSLEEKCRCDLQSERDLM